MALFGFGVQPGDNRNLGDVVHDRITGNKRQEYYVTSSNEPKAKKARRGFFIFQRESKVRNHEGGRIVREMLSEVNRGIIREDEWRRDQGGMQVGRGGWGQGVPDVDPGPPSGFLHSPQIYGPPGGYYDGNGMWHDS